MGSNKNTEQQQYLVPRQVGERLGVNVTKVLGWIDSGELQAVNTSDSNRPRWRISEDAFVAFCDARSSTRSTTPRQGKQYV